MKKMRLATYVFLFPNQTGKKSNDYNTLKTFVATVYQYNTIQYYLSTECIQNQFLFNKEYFTPL